MGSTTDATDMMREKGVKATAEVALARLVEGEPAQAEEAREFGRAVLERLRRSPKNHKAKDSKTAPGRSA